MTTWALLVVLLLAAYPGEEVPGEGIPRETVHFYGWSPDSTRVGWSLTRPDPERGDRRTWYLRETKRTLHGKANLSKVEVPGATFPAYYAMEKFERHDLRVDLSEARTRAVIPLGGDRRLVLELRTEARVNLYFHFEEGADRLLLHRATFEEIYFAFDAAAWLSPDGRRVALALSLDGDIRVDAAFLVLVLPVSDWQRDAGKEDGP